MTADFRHMSPTEAQFVKVYALALKRNYEEFVTTLQLMRTDVGIVCPVRASLLGHELQEMQADFEHDLAHISTRRHMKLRQLPDVPGTDELVRLIQISFFKLIDPGAPPATAPDDKGWFSGHPFEWEQQWQKITKPKELPSNQATTLLSTFMKLLGWNNFKPNSSHEFPFKKLPPWPSNLHDDYDAYEDDEDLNDPDYYDED